MILVFFDVIVTLLQNICTYLPDKCHIP